MKNNKGKKASEVLEQCCVFAGLCKGLCLERRQFYELLRIALLFVET